MGCSASRGGLEHEEALQHVIQMMRELKVKQIASIAARREGRRSREKYYGSLSLETSSCVIYTFFQRSGNRERYAVVIRGVICGLS